MDSQPPARNSEGARCGCKACKLQRVGWGSGYVQHLVLWKVYINCHGLHFVCCVVLLWCANFNDVPAVQLKPLPGQSVNVHYQLLLCREKTFCHSTTLPLKFIEIPYRRNFEDGL